MRSAERMRAAREVADDPRIDVTCLESVIGTRYTVDTVNFLRRRASQLRFVWIMGADNLAQFHRWQNWQRIADAGSDRGDRSPAAKFSRPDRARGTGAGALPPSREHGSRLAEQRAPAWVFLTGLKLNLSSTGLRNPDGSWK